MLAYIGDINPIEKIDRLDLFSYEGELINAKDIVYRSLGVRLMLEKKKFNNAAEQAVYMLAINIDGNYDADKTNVIYDKLMNYRAADVFGFMVFFYLNFLNGNKQGLRFSKMLFRKVKINIAKLLSK